MAFHLKLISPQKLRAQLILFSSFFFLGKCTFHGKAQTNTQHQERAYACLHQGALNRASKQRTKKHSWNNEVRKQKTKQKKTKHNPSILQRGRFRIIIGNIPKPRSFSIDRSWLHSLIAFRHGDGKGPCVFAGIPLCFFPTKCYKWLQGAGRDYFRIILLNLYLWILHKPTHFLIPSQQGNVNLILSQQMMMSSASMLIVVELINLLGIWHYCIFTGLKFQMKNMGNTVGCIFGRAFTTQTLL